MRTPFVTLLTAMTLGAIPVTAATGNDLGTSYVATIEQADCPYSVPRGDAVRCFRAIVPVNYADVDQDGTLSEDAPRISLAIAALQNFVAVEDPNPIVMIAGGPGQASTDFLQGNITALHLRRTRGLIMIDQRGTGRSEPRLGCEAASELEIDENRLNDPDFSPETSIDDRLAECILEWRERGVDLGAFDTRSAALDLMAVRRGLGIRQWNLLGTSYGGRVVQDAMRVDPEGIRAVVLNSPQALSPHFDSDFTATPGQLFHRLFADCANDAHCREEFGDLEAHLARIRAHFAEEGMEIYLREGASGELKRVTVGWADVFNGLYSQMNFAFSAEPVARYIQELARVVDGRLSLNDDEVARIFQNSLKDPDFGIDIAMHMAVRCREDLPAYDPVIIGAAAATDPDFQTGDAALSSYQAACAALEAEPVDDAFYEPVVSDIPALILTGDMDPLTPTVWAERAADTLVQGRLVSFRGMAHDIFGTSICAQALVANFIESPHEEIDARCAEAYVPVFAPAQR